MKGEYTKCSCDTPTPHYRIADAGVDASMVRKESGTIFTTVDAERWIVIGEKGFGLENGAELREKLATLNLPGESDDPADIKIYSCWLDWWDRALNGMVEKITDGDPSSRSSIPQVIQG
jgi:hypothetical protein